MAEVKLPRQIASLSGRMGNYIYYVRNGKQYVRRVRKDVGPLSDHYASIIEPLCCLNI